MSRKQPDKDIERIFFTFTEAQEFLGASHQTIYKLMKEGLPSHKMGKKRVFLKEDLVRWIKERFLECFGRTVARNDVLCSPHNLDERGKP